MRTTQLRWIIPALTMGLLAIGTPAQEVTVEAILPDGSVVALPTICEDQVLELARAIGTPTNPFGVPVIPREVTLRLAGPDLTSQTIQTSFDFGDLDFNRLDDPEFNADLTPRVALDPVVPGAQRVRFDTPLQGQLLALIDTRLGRNCISAAILEGSAPLRGDILAEIEAQVAGSSTVQEPEAPAGTEAGIRQRVSRVRADMRSVATALEAYFIDCNAYPAWIGGASEHSISRGNGLLVPMPTFRRHQPGGAMTITTPIAYLTGYPLDPFNLNSVQFVDEHSSDQPVNTFSYFSDERGWILLSPGPDGDFDITPTLHYSGKTAQPGTALVQRSYDPTNGTVSGGDLYRVRQ